MSRAQETHSLVSGQPVTPGKGKGVKPEGFQTAVRSLDAVTIGAARAYAAQLEPALQGASSMFIVQADALQHWLSAWPARDGRSLPPGLAGLTTSHHLNRVSACPPAPPWSLCANAAGQCRRLLQAAVPNVREVLPWPHRGVSGHRHPSDLARLSAPRGVPRPPALRCAGVERLLVGAARHVRPKKKCDCTRTAC